MSSLKISSTAEEQNKNLFENKQKQKEQNSPEQTEYQKILDKPEEEEIGDIPTAIMHGEAQKLYKFSEDLTLKNIEDDFFNEENKQDKVENNNGDDINKNDDLNNIKIALENKNKNDGSNINNNHRQIQLSYLNTQENLKNKEIEAGANQNKASAAEAAATTIEQINISKNNTKKNIEKESSLSDKQKVLATLKKSEEKTNSNQIQKHTEKIYRCKCCKAILAKDAKGNLLYPNLVNIYPYNCNIRDFISSAGIGLYLYFHFLKICITMLLMALILSSSPFIYFSHSAKQELTDFCSKPINQIKYKNPCLNQIYYTEISTLNTFLKPWNVSNLVIFFSQFSCVTIEDYMQTEYSINKESSFIIFDETIISLVTQVCLFVINMLIFVVSYNTVHEVDFLYITASDYTLMVSNLDQEFKNVQEIIEYLELDGIVPYDISVSYNLSKYKKLRKELKDITKKRNESLKNNKKEIQFGKLLIETMTYEEIEKKYNSKKAKYEEHIKLYENIENKLCPLKNFSGVVFLTFSRPDECQKYYKFFPHSIWRKLKNYINFILEKLFQNKCKIDYKGKSFKFFNNTLVERAPDPVDVIWQNLGLDSGSRKRRVFSIYAYSILLTGINFGVIISLDYVQVQHVKQTNFAASYAISFAISIVITIVNFVLNTILHYLSDFERCRYYTELYLSISIKLTILTFLNSAIIPYLSNLINRRGDFQNFLTNIVIIFLSQSFLTPTLYFLDVYYYYKVIARKFFFRKVKKNERKNINQLHDKSQKELNELFENPPMYIQYKYSYICNTVLICFFYIAIFPLGVLFGILGLLYLYAVEKYLVIHRYKKSENLSHEIYLHYIKYFKVSLFIFALGIFISLPKLAESDKALSILQVILWGIIMFVPIHNFIKINYIKTKQEFLNDILYENAKKTKFFFNYKNVNPANIIQTEKGIKSFTQNHQKLLGDQRIFQNLSKNILQKQFTKLNFPEINEEKEEKLKENVVVRNKHIASHPLPQHKKLYSNDLDEEHKKLFKRFKSMITIPNKNQIKLKKQLSLVEDQKVAKLKTESDLLEKYDSRFDFHNRSNQEINLKVFDNFKPFEDIDNPKNRSLNVKKILFKRENYLISDLNNASFSDVFDEKNLNWKKSFLLQNQEGCAKNTDFTEANKDFNISSQTSNNNVVDNENKEDNEINFKLNNRGACANNGKKADDCLIIASDSIEDTEKHNGSMIEKGKESYNKNSIKVINKKTKN